MEGSKKATDKKCLVEGCDSRMRRDGLCMKHLLASRRHFQPVTMHPKRLEIDVALTGHQPAASGEPEGRNPPSGGSNVMSPPAVTYAYATLQIKRITEAFAALGITVINHAGGRDGNTYVQVASGPTVILDDDDIEQFAALAAKEKGK